VGASPAVFSAQKKTSKKFSKHVNIEETKGLQKRTKRAVEDVMEATKN
jgi:hypothetical protein